ncbi:MAG: hypothetical protein AAGC73_00035 [Verrucomicrobiota bacterium]
MNTKLLLIAPLTALLFTSTTFAQPDQGGGKWKEDRREKMKQRLKQIDADGDKIITFQEATAANAEKLLEHFDEIDADGDDAITREEMKAHHQARRAERRAQSED